MTEIIQRKLNDSAFVRWTALILIALTMFFGYMFVDMMSPLQSMIEAQRGWTPDVFGMYGSSEFIFNVFGFLILAGIILDKMGIRFTGVLSASLMFIGASIKYYGVSDAFIGSGIETWLNSWWVSFPGSAKLASLGFMIFGCGMEMAGITVSKTIAKWFEGKEMALAMGLEMAIARVGVFAVFTISPWLANMAPATVVRPVAFCTLLLLIGLLTAVLFFLPPIFTYLLLPATAIVLFLFCMAWIYVYPMLVVTDLPLRHVLKNSISLSLMCAKHAAAAVVICGLALYYALLYFPISIPFLLFGVLSLLGLVCTFAAWAGIRDHVVAEALQKANTSLLDDADEWAAIWNS